MFPFIIHARPCWLDSLRLVSHPSFVLQPFSIRLFWFVFPSIGRASDMLIGFVVFGLPSIICSSTVFNWIILVRSPIHYSCSKHFDWIRSVWLSILHLCFNCFQLDYVGSFSLLFVLQTCCLDSFCLVCHPSFVLQPFSSGFFGLLSYPLLVLQTCCLD